MKTLQTTTKLNKKNIGSNIKVFGWVKTTRKLGDIIFFDLRDINGILQVVVEPKNPAFKVASKLRNEYVVSVEGKVVQRKSVNKNIYSGDVEIIPTTIEIISEAETTPLIIDEKTDALEQVRLKYKYLDIRRPNITNNLLLRSQFNRIIREYFYNKDFKEIETPIITKPSPGGAGEFAISSSKNTNLKYSLVQSPQIYKQLLMYGGIDKYFQIARCFRDEDSRSDRQLEFTQLDLELLWTNEEEIQKIIESLLAEIFLKINKTKIKTPFRRISYDDAMNKYGSDKPDLRFANEIISLETILKKTKINFLSSALKNKDGIKGLIFDGFVPTQIIKDLNQKIKAQNGKGLSWIYVEKNKLVNGSPKDFSEKEIAEISNLTKSKKYTLFIVSDKTDFALELLGRVRVEVAKQLNIIPEDKYEFCWVVDWPLFELDDNKNLVAKHNPFTSIKEEQKSLFLKTKLNDLKTIMNFKARSYDVVLNGNEIGGGSIRFSNAELQNKVFEYLGLKHDEIKESFGWFLESLKYGAPLHGGIALGLDRIMQLMLKQNSIREVIAFPKSTSGVDEMTGTGISNNK